MANVATAFGFRHIGNVEGYAPTFGVQRKKIALGTTTSIFHGDPILQLSTGYITQVPATGNLPSGNTPTVSGIFQGCEYFSTSQQRKIRSMYWPGSDAQYDVDAFIINAPGSLFVVASNSTVTSATTNYGYIGLNAGFLVLAGGITNPVSTTTGWQGNTLNGLSGATLDIAGNAPTNSGAPASTVTLPFKIVDLWSDYMAQGWPIAGTTSFNGTDNTSAYTWYVVQFNNIDGSAGRVGI